MPLRHRHIGHILRQRERRNLDGIVTRVGDKLDGVVNRPTLENLIANGKLHFSDALKGTQMNTTRVTFQSNSKCFSEWDKEEGGSRGFRMKIGL